MPHFGSSKPNFGSSKPNFGSSKPNFGSSKPNFESTARRLNGGAKMAPRRFPIAPGPARVGQESGKSEVGERSVCAHNGKSGRELKSIRTLIFFMFLQCSWPAR